MFESLEARRHFAVSLAGNVLTITGTTRNDDIAIAAGKQTFVVHDNGKQHAFDVNKVKTIRINGGRGDDSIIISPKLGIRARIEAGEGNDRVGGGAANDTIMGQGGNDTLTGNAGNDYIDAGSGDDRFDDALGINVLHGGGGTDHANGVVPHGFLGTGVESPDLSDSVTARASDLKWQNGRLIMTHFGYLPSISEQSSQAGPTQLANGQYELTSTSTIYGGGGAIIGEFKHEWDITDQAASGIVLTYTSAYVIETYPEPPVYKVVYSVPFLLPS